MGLGGGKGEKGEGELLVQSYMKLCVVGMENERLEWLLGERDESIKKLKGLVGGGDGLGLGDSTAAKNHEKLKVARIRVIELERTLGEKTVECQKS